MSLLWKGMVMLPTSKETVVRAPGSRTRLIHTKAKTSLKLDSL